MRKFLIFILFVGAMATVSYSAYRFAKCYKDNGNCMTKDCDKKEEKVEIKCTSADCSSYVFDVEDKISVIDKNKDIKYFLDSYVGTPEKIVVQKGCNKDENYHYFLLKTDEGIYARLIENTNIEKDKSYEMVKVNGNNSKDILIETNTKSKYKTNLECSLYPAIEYSDGSKKIVEPSTVSKKTYRHGKYKLISE